MIVSVFSIAVGIIILSSLWHLYRAPKVHRAVLRYMLERELGQPAGQPIYGLDLVEAKALPRGTRYVFLAELEEDGFITSSLERVVVPEGMLRRRVYQLTDKGRGVARVLVAVKETTK